LILSAGLGTNTESTNPKNYIFQNNFRKKKIEDDVRPVAVLCFANITYYILIARIYINFKFPVVFIVTLYGIAFFCGLGYRVGGKKEYEYGVPRPRLHFIFVFFLNIFLEAVLTNNSGVELMLIFSQYSLARYGNVLTLG
ncbi:hypothetical protein L9F63_006162, partial [Diploptera punctata]